MPISWINRSDGQDQSGSGQKHGSIASPAGPCGYEITPNGGDDRTGGEDVSPFAQWRETPNTIMGVTKEEASYGTPSTAWKANGVFSTPLDNTTSIGASGKASGSGPKDGAGISSPFTPPWSLKS